MLTPFDDTYFMKKALEEAQEAYERNEIKIIAKYKLSERFEKAR